MDADDACVLPQPEGGPARGRVTRQQRHEESLRGHAAPLLDAISQKLTFMACSEQHSEEQPSSADTGDAAAALAMLAGTHQRR